MEPKFRNVSNSNNNNNNNYRYTYIMYLYKSWTWEEILKIPKELVIAVDSEGSQLARERATIWYNRIKENHNHNVTEDSLTNSCEIQ